VAKFVVGQDHRRSLTGDIRPGAAHRDADVGAAQRGGVVDAVARHGNHVLLGAQRVGDPQLGLRRAAREDQLAALAEQQVELVVAHSLELVAGDDRRPVACDAHAAGDRRRGEAVVAGDDDDPDPRVMTRGDRVRDLAPRRVEHRHQPEQAQVALGLLAPVWQASSPAEAPTCHSEYTQPLARVVRHAPLDLLELSRSQLPLAAVRSEDRGAPRQQRLGRPLRVDPQLPVASVTVDMSFRTGSKWNCSCRARSRSATLTSTPSLAAAASMGTSVGSPADPSGCALLQADIVSARAETIRFGARSARSLGASRSTVCGAVQILVTVIRFSVSVPVLSVQITLVEPSVSTALSRLITAPRRTSPRTPTARARVITGSSPSGTLPTNSPTANTTASLMGNPATKVPIGMNAAPVTTAIRAISHAPRRTCASKRALLLLDPL